MLAVTPTWSAASSEAASTHVRLVCNGTMGFTCPTGRAAPHYRSIQAAVDAAHPGDWILVWPGDYRESGNNHPDHPAGVWIMTSGIFLRGMDRNLVVIDGTKSGPECSPAPADQNLGPINPGTGAPSGRDGVLVWKTDGTWLENLTACNFLTSAEGAHGNQIWWNGGDGSGQIGMHSYWGDYLTATSTYATTDAAHPEGGDNPRGEYGIFSSNVGNGTSPFSGIMDHSYANNMGHAAFYIGACPNCAQILENSRGENSALDFGHECRRQPGHQEHGIRQQQDRADGKLAKQRRSPQSGLCPSGSSPPDPEHAPSGFPNCTGGTWIDAQQISWYQAYGNAHDR